MKTFPRSVLLIVPLLAFIVGIPVVAGYADLFAVESSASAHDKSLGYESAAQRLPWYTDLYENAGIFATQAGEYERAISLFQTARAKGQLSSNGHFQLGRAYYLSKQDDQAIAEWQGLLDDEQQRVGASQSLASLYHARGEFERERQVLQQWLVFDPHNPDAQYGLGLLLFAQASPDALPLFEAVAASSPTLKSHVDGLSAALKMALDEPGQAGQLSACGRTLAAIGEWPLAEQAFLQALQADPQLGPAWAWLGEARQHTGSGDPAAAFAQAVALAPDLAEVHAMFGLYHQRRHDWQNAQAEFESAARLEPNNAVWQMSLGDVTVHLGNLVQALADYQNATTLAPKDAQTWRALALFAVENEVDVEGVGRDAALQAYALEPQNPQNMDILGRALMATEQWDAAEAIFKKAMAAAPQDAAPVFHLGLLYLQTDRLDLAKQFLQSAQALDPSGPIGTQATNLLTRYFP